MPGTTGLHRSWALDVVAEIAHIRQEKPAGPRYDPDHQGDVNGPDNLLLLCGKHHRPVDRHESVYEIAELQAWKSAQREAADGGIEISASEARTFARLTDEERSTITQIARLAERVVTTGESAHLALKQVIVAHGAAQQDLRWRLPPIWEVEDESGERTLINDRGQLPHVEEQRWAEEFARVRASHLSAVVEAIGALREEVAVLRMMGDLGSPASGVVAVAGGAADHVGNDCNWAGWVTDLRDAVDRLWRAANGELAGLDNDTKG